jgi:hypothetical protein
MQQRIVSLQTKKMPSNDVLDGIDIAGFALVKRDYLLRIC